MIKLSAFADEIDKSLDVQIKVLKENNIELLELRSVDGINVKDFTDEQVERYSSKLKACGISVWAIGSPLGKVDITVDFAEYEKTVRRVCEIAKAFNAKRIRMFSFFKAYDNAEKVYEYLSKMVEIGNEYGVYMCLENEKDVFGDTLERVKRVLSNVKGLKFVYDPANFIQMGEYADQTLGALADNAEYFHVKDVIKETDELVPAGYGDGKIDELVSRITDDKVLTLEPHLALFEGYAQIDNTQMKNKFKFDNNVDSFNFATKSLKEILLAKGYKEIKGGFVLNK